VTRPHTAVTVLALVRENARVRDAYLRSYRGEGDALAALAQVAAAEAAGEATTEVATEAATAQTHKAATESAPEADAASHRAEAAELRRLQALTYGRPGPSTDGAESEEAARQLAALTAADHLRSAEVYAALGRLNDLSGEDAAALPDERTVPPDHANTDEYTGAQPPRAADELPDEVPDDTDPPGRAPLRSRLVLSATLAAGIVIGCALGVVASVSLGFSQATPTTPTSSPVARDEAALPYDVLIEVERPGDLDAAQRWFDRRQSPQDVFAGEILLSEGPLSSTASRFAGVTADGWRLWVAHSDSDGFCLLAQRDEGVDPVVATRASCATRDKFAEFGVHVDLEGSTVAWNGKALVAAIRR
jgi:hypothetical protein